MKLAPLMLIYSLEAPEAKRLEPDEIYSQKKVFRGSTFRGVEVSMAVPFHLAACPVFC